jgi:hypothetical protein
MAAGKDIMVITAMLFITILTAMATSLKDSIIHMVGMVPITHMVGMAITHMLGMVLTLMFMFHQPMELMLMQKQMVEKKLMMFKLKMVNKHLLKQDH